MLAHRQEVATQRVRVVPEKASEHFSESRPSVLDANWQTKQLCVWRCNTV